MRHFSKQGPAIDLWSVEVSFWDEYRAENGFEFIQENKRSRTCVVRAQSCTFGRDLMDAVDAFRALGLSGLIFDASTFRSDDERSNTFATRGILLDVDEFSWDRGQEWVGVRVNLMAPDAESDVAVPPSYEVSDPRFWAVFSDLEDWYVAHGCKHGTVHDLFGQPTGTM